MSPPAPARVTTTTLGREGTLLSGHTLVGEAQRSPFARVLNRHEKGVIEGVEFQRSHFTPSHAAEKLPHESSLGPLGGHRVDTVVATHNSLLSVGRDPEVARGVE